MKKFLAVLAIVAVLSLGIIGALAVIPHTHGKDFYHSHHETCPVYQFSFLHSSATVAVFHFISVIFLVAYLVQAKQSFLCVLTRQFAFLRAPPTLP